jgi:hypothetical protein
MIRVYPMRLGINKNTLLWFIKTFGDRSGWLGTGIFSMLPFFRDPFWVPGAVLGMWDGIQREKMSVLSAEFKEDGYDHGTPDIRHVGFESLVACDRQSSIGHPIRRPDQSGTSKLYSYFHKTRIRTLLSSA